MDNIYMAVHGGMGRYKNDITTYPNDQHILFEGWS